MKAVKIIVISASVVLVVAPFAAFLFLQYWFTGDHAEEHARQALDHVWAASVDEPTKEAIRANEDALRDALSEYRTAQAGHRKRYGFYAEDLARLELPGGMAQATLESTVPAEGYLGYRFGHVPLHGVVDTNYTSEYTLCAVPAVYRFTGIHTYAIGPTGYTFRKDNWGTPVENIIDVSDGTWEVEEPRGAEKPTS